MSLSSLNASIIDDIDDIVDDGPVETPATPSDERPGEALARLMLEAALNRKLRRLMQAASRLIIFKTIDSEAARLLDSYLSAHDRRLVVQACTEPARTGGRQEPRGHDELRKLEYGRTVILISQDPERLLVPEAMANADAVIAVPPPNLDIVRRTIRAVTGKMARGLLPADIDGLGIADLVAAIRPGLTARECVANLRRAAHNRGTAQAENTARPLEQLAMTRMVSDWAFGTLQIMQQLRSGDLACAALRHACLEGPPGTGKTTVAAALAKSAGWHFVSSSAGQWFAESGGHLGDVIRAARRFFDEIALASGPVVGLLDEIDALPDRAAMDPSDAQWWTPVITFVLTELDRLRQSERPILLIGATNHFDRLDAALVRPGRLETRVPVLLPDFDDRRRLFATCLGEQIGADGLATLARLAVMATPAQIESWCQSAMAIARAETRPLQLRDLVDLIAPPDGRTPEQDRSVAIHEAGHAIVALELGLPVEEVSILAIGAVGGWVKSALDRHSLITRAEIERHGAMILGGRAADTVLGGGAHAGAAADIEAVNALLKTAMLEMGLYGSLSTAATSDLRLWRGNVSLWAAISAELARLHERASAIVERRRDDIFVLVDVLLAERVVTGDRLREVLASRGRSAKARGRAAPASAAPSAAAPEPGQPT